MPAMSPRTIVTPFMIVPLLALVAAPGHAETPEAKGFAIAKQLDEYNTGFKGEKSTMTMKLINAQGDSIERRMDSRVKEKPGGDRSIVTFRFPPDVNGTRMLTWSHATKADDQWLYMPALKRVKRISSKKRTGSFMGSEFAYEDLGSQELDKYTYLFLREESVEGRLSWVIERKPTDPDSGYSKQVTWLDKEYMGATKIDFYDRKNELLKTMTFENWQQHGKYWRADTIDCFNHQTKKRSILSWKNRKLGVSLDDSDFDSEALDE